MRYNSLLLFVGLLVSTASGLAQSIFEKGYFIERTGEKTECYILIEDWQAGGYLTYRKDYKEPSQSKALTEITEIGKVNAFKVLHVKVLLDISGDSQTLLSYSQDPEWSEQEIFLWMLVEGSYNLYAFQNDGLTRFFYSTQNQPLQQLIFKKYKTATGIEINDSFKLALFQNANCTPKMSNYFNSLSYTEEMLMNHFLEENKCAGVSPVSYSRKASDLALILPISVSGNSEITEMEKMPLEKTDKSSNVVRYFGLEINQLIQQIIDLNSNNNTVSSPYQIQYSSNSKKTGRGVSYGLAYGRNKFKDDSNGTIRETIDRSISFRIGYERKRNWGKRWIALHGYDVTLGGTKANTKSSQNGPLIEIENESSFWGFGPRVGLMLNLGQRVFLGTEATYYLQFAKGSQTISTGQPNSSQKSSSINLTLPVSLFLSVKMGE